MRQAAHAATTGDYSTLTMREVEIPEPTEYSASDVKTLRERLEFSQNIFAQLVGVSHELVSHWEYGIRKPAPLARRLLDKINEDPSAYLTSLV
jgi:putative transcriptional regulator